MGAPTEANICSLSPPGFLFGYSWVPDMTHYHMHQQGPDTPAG